MKRHRHVFFYWRGKERKQGQQCYYDDIKDTQDAQPGPKEDRQGGSASTQKEAAQALTTTAVADEVENRRRARYWMSHAKAGGAGKRIVRSPDRKPKGPKQPKAAYQGQLASSQVVCPPTSPVLVLHGVRGGDMRDVEDTCSQFGSLRQVWVDEQSGGDACVLFFHAHEAQACQTALNGRWVAGQQITVELTNYAAAMEAQRREEASGPETGRQLRDQFQQRMQEDMEKLREDVSEASGQVAVAVGQALSSAIARWDGGMVNNILQDPAHDGIKKEIAMHCSYNGMAALHHACRVVALQWVRALLEWGPEVANMPTYDSRRWTPLQCLVENPVTEICTQDDCQAMVSDLVNHMNEAAIQNQTGFGRRSGGLNVLHQVASRNSPIFIFTIDKIQAVFGVDVVIAMLNCRAGDGRGVVDMSTAMAMDLKQRFPGAVEQTTSQKLYEEQEKGQGCATAAPGERRKRSRDWQEDWQEDWHQSDWSSHSGWKRRR